ncbi:methyltransferase domain-containing protein [Streptomyces mobaraensis]|uniref:methyltransferase domain-containing protein n=1 Tax=Streptomyces mobaraensis TaxID=35621 RepID=UPI001F039D07|nr:methyltransferase domain-containing protein [Streptomyces mobaraensis]
MTPDTDPADLRETLVTRLIDGGHLRTPAVIAAFRDTERHHFLPGVDLQAAYAEDAVLIKHGETGEMISCISAPSIVATQLEQMGAEPGHKILEAGAATGYNACLLAHLVAPDGHVWTVDVDQDLVDGAQKNLAQAGATNVTAVLGDGAAGLPEHAPFDRIQFTVGAGDVPVGILDQLASGGRLILPMRIRGSISRSFAFERDGDTWKAVSCEMATFVPLRKGVCNDTYTLVPMAGEGNVRGDRRPRPRHRRGIERVPGCGGPGTPGALGLRHPSRHRGRPRRLCPGGPYDRIAASFSVPFRNEAWLLLDEHIVQLWTPRIKDLDDCYTAATIDDDGQALDRFHKLPGPDLWWWRRRPRILTGDLGRSLRSAGAIGIDADTA